jgi:hypothetical protein
VIGTVLLRLRDWRIRKSTPTLQSIALYSRTYHDSFVTCRCSSPSIMMTIGFLSTVCDGSFLTQHLILYRPSLQLPSEAKWSFLIGGGVASLRHHKLEHNSTTSLADRDRDQNGCQGEREKPNIRRHGRPGRCRGIPPLEPMREIVTMHTYILAYHNLGSYLSPTSLNEIRLKCRALLSVGGFRHSEESTRSIWPC